MIVWSVFRRTKHGDKDRDGNPLIYALKHRDRYNIGYSSIKTLYGSFCPILEALASEMKPETLVPIPSGASVNHILAERMRRLSGNAATLCDCFEKLSIASALELAPAPEAVAPALRRDYTSALHVLQKSRIRQAPIEMKLIRPAKVRMYFKPIGFQPGAWGNAINGKRVVFIEDVFSTGTTLVCAEKMLRSRYAPASLSVITLLSAL